MADDRTVEARCRRLAQSTGYQLESSRRRDSRALNYGSYRLIELRSGRIVVPAVVDATGYGASLAEIMRFLEARAVPAQAPPPGARPTTRAGRHRRT